MPRESWSGEAAGLAARGLYIFDRMNKHPLIQELRRVGERPILNVDEGAIWITC